MSSVAAPRSTSTRTRTARRAPVRISVTSALLILACAAVLIGIVTLQVSVLRLNSERGDLQAKRDQMISANSELVGQLGGKLAPGVLAQRAAKQGLVLAPVENISTGSLGR
jgi:cell division protein FtsL